VAYELDGSLVAESAPIGRGNRWRNQLAVGPFGLDGETEIIDVRTPHIGGTVQAFRLSGDGDGRILERVAASDNNYTSHPIGLRNLDMGIAVDADVDGRPDVVVATADRGSLAALTRTTESPGWTTITTLELPGRLTSNIAVAETDGVASLAAAAGTTVRIWRAC